MEHGIAVDAVIPCIATLEGVDGTAEVALLVQQVVELEQHGEGLALEEALRYLSVPYQLVGVHRVVVISTAAAFGDIGRECRTPGGIEAERGSIAELPCIEVALALQLVAAVHIVDRPVEFYRSPSFTITHIELFTQIQRAGAVFLHTACTVQGEVAHVVGKSGIGIGIGIPRTGRVDRGVVEQSSADAPVAVDVLRTAGAPASHLVIGHHIAY